MFHKRKKNEEELRRIQELRRSNAAGLHKTGKSYSRKRKHQEKLWRDGEDEPR